MPRLSIIIVTYNSRSDVERCLEAFSAWSAEPGASFGLAIAWAEGVRPAA